MKQVLIVILFLFSCNASHSQIIDSAGQKNNEQYRYYMNKRISYNIAGALMLTGGLAMSALSFGSWAGDDFNGPWKYESLFFLGAGLALASIPVFISAGKNKKKAMLALKGETAGWGNYNPGGNYLAIGVRIQL